MSNATVDPLLTKLAAPVLRPNLVARLHPLALLDTGSEGRLTLVDAPAGWGKTTAVGDWLRVRPGWSAGWLALDPEDDDPVRFWTYVILAIRGAAGGGEIGERAIELLHTPRVSAITGAIPSLLNDLSSSDSPFVFVIDDYHLISDAQIHAGMIYLIEHLPPNVHAIVVTRSDPPFPLARWRVRGELVELRAEDLRFDAAASDDLLNRILGLDLQLSAIARLHERTEGWVAGLMLAAISLRNQSDRESFVDGFAGDNRHIVDYLGGEVLDALSPPVREFLARTSILTRFSGELCDAVTGSTDSSELLTEIERSNHFLVPLDTRREWFRYHQLFRELLTVELERTEPDLVFELHRRAASWHLDRGQIVEAIAHSTRAGDEDRAAELLAEHWGALLQSGDLAAITQALDRMSPERVRSDPRLCLVRAWMTINLGRVGELSHWVSAASSAAKDWPGEEAVTFAAAATMLRCIERYLSGDVGAAVAAAREAIDLNAEEHAPWRSVGCPVLGIALYWSARNDESASTLHTATERARASGNRLATVHALGCLALAAAERRDEASAWAFAEEASDISQRYGLGEHWVTAMGFLARGRLLADRNDLVGAEAAVTIAVDRSRRGLARLELAAGLAALADLSLRRGVRDAATALVDEAEAAIAGCPDPGVARQQVTAMMNRTRKRPESAPRRFFAGDDLSDRERAVLAMLRTDLNLREIADALFVSSNTVKSHCRAVYRKLGVSSRLEAVDRARALGLA